MKIIIPEAGAGGLKHRIKEAAEAWLSSLQRPSEESLQGEHMTCVASRDAWLSPGSSPEALHDNMNTHVIIYFSSIVASWRNFQEVNKAEERIEIEGK